MPPSAAEEPSAACGTKLRQTTLVQRSDGRVNLSARAAAVEVAEPSSEAREAPAVAAAAAHPVPGPEIGLGGALAGRQLGRRARRNGGRNQAAAAGVSGRDLMLAAAILGGLILFGMVGGRPARDVGRGARDMGLAARDAADAGREVGRAAGRLADRGFLGIGLMDLVWGRPPRPW